MEHRRGRAGPSAALADQLIRRLRDRFAPGGFLHYGQGKWYPGESLPRWTFSLYWRTRRRADLAAMPALIAEEGARTKAGPAEAETLLQGIADGTRHRAGDGDAGLRGSGELDPEGRRPAGERHAGEFQARGSRGAPPHRAGVRPRADHAVGLCPAGPALAGEGRAGHRWRSEKWKLRRGHLYLVPGDSPVGFRLPLGKLPHVSPSDYPYTNVADPTVPRGPLPDFATRAPPAERAAAGRRQPGAADGAFRRRRDRAAGAGRAGARRGRRRGAHRAVGRAARRAALRLHAAGGERRGLSGAGRRRRGERRGRWGCRSISRAMRRRPTRG